MQNPVSKNSLFQQRQIPRHDFVHTVKIERAHKKEKHRTCYQTLETLRAFRQKIKIVCLQQISCIQSRYQTLETLRAFRQKIKIVCLQQTACR